MSHQPERTEKNCLNCGATVQGRFCHVCGQENIVPKQSFWGLTKHFVYDIFHFDGKFFESLRLLFFRPGIISREYIMGKRVKYLDPIRMYLFTSAIFFLIFFSIESTRRVGDVSGREILSKAERLELAMVVNTTQAQQPGDTVLQQQLNLLLDTTYIVGMVPMEDSTDYHSLVQYQGSSYKLTAIKDSPDSLFQNEEKGWLTRTVKEKWAKFEKKYSDDLDEGFSDFIDGLLHKLPYLLFVSLPFFAGILKLLYLRRKELYFSDHAVFTLHHYIVSFLLILLFLGFSQLENVTGWKFFNFLAVLMFFLWPLYLLIGMKRFYGQPWSTTLGKFLLVNFLGLFTLMLLMMVFLFFSIFQL